MAFKLAVTPTFRQKVTVELPNEKGGKDVSSFTAIYRRLEEEEFQAFIADIQRDDDDPDKPSRRELAERVLEGWADVIEEVDGKAVQVDYSPATRYAMLSIPQAVQSLVTTFVESHQQGKRKN